MKPLTYKTSPLKAIERHLRIPMLVLAFVWLSVLLIELVDGTNAILLAIGTSILILFIMYFILRLVIGPNPAKIVKKNWLFILAVLVSALRFSDFFQRLPLVRAVTATFAMQVIWIIASADQGLRSLRRSMGTRGVGYALTFTFIVILAGAAGMFHFEKDEPNPLGIHSYPKALWWTAMQMTNIGSGYSPTTPGGQFVCLGISVVAATMFGYLTAVLATFFVGRDVGASKPETARDMALKELRDEIALLRTSMENTQPNRSGPEAPLPERIDR